MRTPPRTAVRRLALARAISETGSAAAYTALLDAVFIRSGGSAAWLGLTLLVTHGVAGMLGPLGGALGDRFDRKRVMILSDLASAAAFLGLALVRNPGALVGVGFVAALAEIPFWTSSAAAIPNVVEKPEDIAWANSLVTAGRNAGITLGPVLGGVLVAAAGHEVVFIANAASFVVSVGLVASVRARFSEDRTAQDAEEFRGLRAGYRFLFHDRVLRIIAVAWVVVVLGAGIAQVADRPLSAVFHAGAIGFGLLIALWGLGSVVGSIAARKLTERTEPGWLIGGMAIAGVAAMGTWASPWFPPIVGLMFLMGFGDAMSEVADQGIRQRRTPDAVRGRLIGAMESLVHVAVAVAYVMAAGALALFGPQGAYALAGLSSLAAALLLLPTIRRLRGGPGKTQVGYRVHPVGPYVVPFPDGRVMIEYDDNAKNRDEFAKFSKRDADAAERWDAWISGLADVLGPLLMTTPPRIGSRRPSDVWEQLRLAWRFRGLDVRTIGEVTRLLTMSVADIVDRFFESDVVKTVRAIDGLIGTWAGPYEPGTGYVMAHHSIGNVGGGTLGGWGVPEGGMGAVAEALVRSARSFGAEVRTNAPVERVLVRHGQVSGVALEGGEELMAPVVVTACHPKITFLRQLDRSELPEDGV